ncbi:hypothetical protein FGLOB1_7768 [Fusarium globosum]|uniref:Heterokaryon incompatibility domain-containing protein n=1 Tax=Fusarium globosum TaxID=78864 RepID=A0A8H5Y684_9HYPO|nr:hypothetical protein FGLOB1_7768 [Fusarium globosum]
MENSAHQLRAGLEALVNSTQSCPIYRDLKPGEGNDELNINSTPNLRDGCGYCRILQSAMNSSADGPTTQTFVHSKEGEPISVEYFSEKNPGDSYMSKAGFIIYSHDKSRLIPDLGILGAYPKSTELATPVNTINAQIKQPLRTIMANFEDLKKSINATSLPIVFQQAICIVRMLRIEYIWIDSLGIIQDSQSDWELESLQMCDYYENSFLTISTATSPNSTIPFLVPRDKRWWPDKLNLTNGSSSEDIYAQRIASEPEEEGAAAGEFANGEFAMGYYNEIGIHVQKDLAEARRWYQLSADHGNGDARHDRNPKAIPLASQTFGETRSKVVDQTRLEAVSKPETIIVGIDLGAVMQAARLRKSVNIPQKNCFSALEDFCSGAEPARKQATRFLTSYIGTLWNHVVHEILSKTEGWDLEFILSLSIPVYFSWEMENRLLRMARDATAHNGASKVVEVNALGQLQAVILNSLKDQYRLDRSARGPSVVMENGEIVVVCDCGGTGARALSYEVHTESPPLVQQLTSWNAENFGTPSVDMEFINYLLNHSSSNLGTSRSALNELDFFIETEWEYGLKRTFRGDDNHDIILQLPRKAISALKRLQPSSSRLLIKPKVVRKFFEKSLMAIEKVIDAQFAALEVIGRKPNSILLVGGLSQSPYIIQQLQKKFDVIFHLPYDKWGSYGLKNYKIITFQEGAPFQIQATLEWESLEVFEKAAASEAAAAVFGDIKNFYDGNPVLLKGPVVASETVASS